MNDDTFDALVLQDNEVTRDSATDLDWLDIDAYMDSSYIDIVAAFSDTNHALFGWRHASRAEVGTFFDHLGLKVNLFPNTSTSSNGGADARAAQAYTGSGTVPDPLSSATFRARGITSTFDDIDDEEQYLAYYLQDFWTNPMTTRTSAHQMVTWDESQLDLGHWIVQTSPSQDIVPEPSTFSMLAFGCIAMAGYTRLRRRRK